MAELIDKEQTYQTLSEYYHHTGTLQNKALREALDRVPVVDTVPVIRCKDCKYYRADGDCWHEWDNDGRIYYQSIINEPNPDDYCSRAERKEE